MAERRIKSVLELARYKIGQTAYWLILRANGQDKVEIPPGDEWMANSYHPKILFERGLNKSWPKRDRLPKLYCTDFDVITSLLTSRLAVEPFIVREITRSSDTGEFIYSNDANEWMPESLLMDTEAAARGERDRIMRMMVQWANK